MSTPPTHPPLGADQQEPREAQKLGWGFDIFPACCFDESTRKFDLEKARAIWRADGYGDVYKVRLDLTRDHAGSWNKPPMAWVLWLLFEGEREAADLLLAYANAQLGDHGLWGREITSWLYWWPLPALGLAHELIRDVPELEPASRQELEKALRRLLQAHVLTLGLFALPEPHPEQPDPADGPLPLVWCPGMRVLPNDRQRFNTGLSYFFSCAVEPHRVIPPNANPRRFSGWPFRVAEKLSHKYLGAPMRQRLAEHRTTGQDAAWIVRAIKNRGVRFRTSVQVRRYENGDFSALLDRNLHGTKPPLVAVSRVGAARRKGSYHVLLGQQGRAQGAELRGRRIVFAPRDRSIKAPDPSKPLLYSVEISQRGPKLIS